MEMMLDKKQIQEIFLFEFEMGHKEWWQLATSRIHLTQGLLTNLQRSGDSTSFAKETRALKMRSTVVGHGKLTTTKRHHWGWSSYNYTRGCPRSQRQPFYSQNAIDSWHSSALSFVYGPTLTSIHDYWKNHNFYSMELCRQSIVSAS